MDEARLYYATMERDEEIGIWNVTCEELPEFFLEIELLHEASEKIQFAMMDHLYNRGEDTNIHVKILMKTSDSE